MDLKENRSLAPEKRVKGCAVDWHQAAPDLSPWPLSTGCGSFFLQQRFHRIAKWREDTRHQ